jgi:hypothetical protein
MSLLAVELLIGSALCLVHLGIGLAIGWRLGGAALPAPIHLGDRLDLITEERAGQQQCDWDDIRLRLADLASAAVELRPTPREALAKWVADLVQLSNDLRERLADTLAGAAEPRSSDQQCTRLPSHEIPDQEGKPHVMTNAEILELCETLSRPVDDEDVPPIRYKLSAKQPLAPYPSRGAVAFRTVQCHDLSVKEIRYFVDDAPIEEKVIIGLGLPSPVKWLLAEIEDSRSAFMYGRMGYLVAARLIKSIDNHTRTASQQPVEANQS